MKKSFHSIFLTLLLAVSASALEKSDQAHIKLPWDILQGVLKLDNKEVRLTWEEFQILLKQLMKNTNKNLSTEKIFFYTYIVVSIIMVFTLIFY